MKKTVHYLMMTTVILFAAAGCRKLISIRNPSDQVITANVFSDAATATSAVQGLYATIMESNMFIFCGGLSISTGLSSDEIYNRNSSPEPDAFRSNSIQPSSDDIIVYFWSPAYTYIYHCNAILEGIAAAQLDPALADQLKGEAKFIRALCYFYLSNLFGDVPLITTTDYRINQSAAQRPRVKIREQVLADLLDSRRLLANAPSDPEHARVDKWAVAALMARFYLYEKDWVNAAAMASELIQSGQFQLEPDLAAVFLKTSPEVILQLSPVSTFNSTAEGLYFLPTAAAASRPSYLLTQELLDAFEAGDKRRDVWVKSKTVNSIVYTYAYKYKVRSSPDPATEYNVAFRLAEQYLIRAEARAQQGDLTGALSDLNTIRERAGLGDLESSVKEEIIAAILQERRVELFTEWGHRWFDLIRTGKATEVLSLLKVPNWQATDTLYPLPLSQLKLNSFLRQNPGY